MGDAGQVTILTHQLPVDTSRLPNLVDIDLRGVKLEPRLQQAYLGGTDSLLAELKDRDTRTELQLKLERRLREGVRSCSIVFKLVRGVR